MRRPWCLVVLGALLAVSPAIGGSEGAPRLPTVTYEGRTYVELDRVAALVPTRADATAGSIRAYLRVPGHTVTLTRNWARVLVDDTPIVLAAPVRVRKGVWLVPDGFVERVMPKLSPPIPVARAASSPRPPAVQTVSVSSPVVLSRAATDAEETTLEEFRYRSYPSFTRLVLETS